MKPEEIVRYCGITVVIIIVVCTAEYWIIASGIYAGLSGMTDSQFFALNLPLISCPASYVWIGRFLPLLPLLGLVIGFVTRWRRTALAETLLQIGCVLTAAWIASAITFHEWCHRSLHPPQSAIVRELEAAKTK
ncbi:MAG: hypothetical protein JXQ75_12160 [Phycisphaerae bacterium]|nr:hypothetical protein [Phycisphaerae bacterium]